MARRALLGSMLSTLIVGIHESASNPNAASAQEVEAEDEDVIHTESRELSKHIRLRLADGKARADLVRRWNTAPKRGDLAAWLKDEGYDRIDDAMEFFQVYDRDELQRDAAAQVWKKSGNRRAGLYLSLEGNKEEWYGLTFNDGKAKTILTVRKQGKIRERNIDSSVSSQLAGDSVTTEDNDSFGCNACEVGCALGGTGWIALSAGVCYANCGAAIYKTLGAASNCITGCTAFVATEGATVSQCPEICDAVGAC